MKIPVNWSSLSRAERKKRPDTRSIAPINQAKTPYTRTMDRGNAGGAMEKVRFRPTACKSGSRDAVENARGNLMNNQTGLQRFLSLLFPQF